MGKKGGVLSGDRVVCPAHAACFNVETGDIEDGPGMDHLPMYDIEVRGDRVFATLPVTAANKLVVRRKPCRRAVGEPGATSGGDIVIIGCGAAAAGAVETLLAAGHAGSVTVVSKDTAGFWDRVRVSKNVTADDHSVRSKVIDPEEWSDAGVSLVFGHEVTSVSTDDRTVYCAPVDGGEAKAIRYDKLLCASGGPARAFLPHERFSLPGADLGNIFVLRDARDNGAVYAAVNEFRDSERGARVVIVGSSFIGMEAAKSLMGEAPEGLVSSIDVIGMETEPFERVLGVEVGATMRRMHHRLAAQSAEDCDGAFELRFHMETKTTGFVGAGAVRGVCVTHSDGSEEVLEADVVVIGSGMIPAIDYLSRTEARCGNGVRVDETLKACDHVWAAGDIAEIPNTRFATCDRDAFIRIEHWDSAIDQGRCAARNMLQELAGRDGQAFDVVPFFWTGQPDVNIRYAGHCHFVSSDDTVIHGDLGADVPSATVFYCSGPKVRSRPAPPCNWDSRARRLAANDQREQSLIACPQAGYHPAPSRRGSMYENPNLRLPDDTNRSCPLPAASPCADMSAASHDASCSRRRTALRRSLPWRRSTTTPRQSPPRSSSARARCPPGTWLRAPTTSAWRVFSQESLEFVVPGPKQARLLTIAASPSARTRNRVAAPRGVRPAQGQGAEAAGACREGGRC